MWLSKMFLVISKKDRVKVGAELKGELRSGGAVILFFKKFFITSFRWVGITQKGGKEGTTILGSD